MPVLMQTLLAQSCFHINVDAILERPFLTTSCGMFKASQLMLARQISYRFSGNFSERDYPVWRKGCNLACNH